MKSLHICTIYNQRDQYHDLIRSLKEAGFTEDRCRYSGFDNSSHNFFEPYSTISQVVASTEEPYLVFCHQDILLNQGHGYDILMARLSELDKIDPSWAICGNAGVNNKYEYVVRITDRYPSPNWMGKFPQSVHSLDENFLVIKSGSKIRCSSGIGGYHFYGTDLCLQAITTGHSCYVIDFHLSHLGQGTFSQAFWETKSIFYKNWFPKFTFCYVKTMTGQLMCLGKSKPLRTIGSIHIMAKLLLLLNRIFPFLYPKKRNFLSGR